MPPPLVALQYYRASDLYMCARRAASALLCAVSDSLL